MLRLSPRDHKGPYISDAEIRPGAIAQNEARRAAWAFEPGAASPLEPHHRSRIHRGQLPDVDFSQIVRAPRRSLLRRIAAALGFAAPDLRSEPEEWRVIQPARNIDQADLPAPGNVVPFSRAA